MIVSISLPSFILAVCKVYNPSKLIFFKHLNIKLKSVSPFVGSTVSNGLRIHYHANYAEVRDLQDDLYKDIGLDSVMHYSLLCYVRARLFEDAGDYQSAQYHRQMFEKTKNEYPMRRSGVRVLSVPRI